MTKKLTLGAVWTVTMRWSIRGLGFISTLILARLLTPEDFGIVAMATIVAGLANVLFEFGVATVLIQDPDPRDEDYNTAWSLRLLQTFLAGLCIALAAPFAVSYFGEPRIEVVLWVIALATAIGGLENIGIVKFQKALDFKNDFQFEVSRKLVQFVVTLTLAFLFRSYWALIFGILVGRVSGVVISYLIHPYRPSWTLSAFTKIWSFSRWILVLRIGAYLRNEVDKFVIGNRGDAGDIGRYFLASEIANIISTEILAPVNRAVFPALSQLNRDPGVLRRALHLALAAQATVTFPLAIGLALVADDLVPILLGDQWTDMIPIMQILAWLGIPLCIRYTFSSALTALRKLAVISLAVWFEIAVFLLFVTAFYADLSILGIAIVKVILSMVVSAVLLIHAAFLGLTRLSGLAAALWRPSAAAITMVACLQALHPHLTGNHGIDLVIQTIAGGVAYTAAIVALWLLTNRQDGFETLVFRRLGMIP